MRKLSHSFLLFSFDLRSQTESGKHWKDDRTLGNRGYVFYEEIPHSCKSYLNIEPVTAGDSGQYRCRVDYEVSPTRNTRIKLKLIGKSRVLIWAVGPIQNMDEGSIFNSMLLFS